VAIARALANDPPLLLADEPTGNLDDASIDLVLGLLDQLRSLRRELTLVVVTHDARVASRADRSVHLRAGRLEAGEPSHVAAAAAS
jgi:putative ABC transport system ATP-binding protein